MRKVSYNPLLKKLIDLKMNRTELAKKANLSRGTMTKIGKDEYIALEVIERICNTLDCDITDVVSILPVDGEGQR